jgi:hypothetical protein
LCIVAIGCDKDERKKALVDSVVGDSGSSTAPSASAGSFTSTTPPRDAGTFTLPERPIPKPETMVTQGMSQEIQMKAIAYMAGMRAPRPDDANADEAYAGDLVEKLKPVLLAMDHGPDKGRWNRVEMVAKGRQIDLFMSEGCDPKAPFNAVVQRLNAPLTTLLSHGVLVLRCNDTKRQCLQSVRDQDDVLCTTAFRHK